ncbi:hypothetical protein OIE69_13700 [Actinacidiphila glaucinigra]|uniref:hypothetical protein n=1 Tax=Actinacidiphila glaucinigra TaxID=235986 RepID=UPI002DD987BC|nr:hypothetical protein [Actinacidiphila glaucinigra]WSD59905.1 hypothetical protein OIE69_13700 [Actinacidiphila glaucinigra]
MLTYDAGGSEDSVVTTDVDVELQQWDAGWFMLRGEPLRLAWLDGSEADRAARDYGW